MGRKANTSLVARVNPRLKAQAGPGLVRFLEDHLRSPGAPAEIGRAMARLEYPGAGKDDDRALRIRRGCAKRVSKMLQPKTAPYPESASLWDLSNLICNALKIERRWMLPPVLYYQAGQLRALVHSIGTVDFVRLGGPNELVPLLRELPDVAKSKAAQRTWDLGPLQRKAFTHPTAAELNFVPALKKRDDAKANLRVAHVLANQLDVPYIRRRELVVDYLYQWAVGAKSRTDLLR